ncbi:hypothetical protein GJ496_008879 [Pomphorhynchus laevis]|nr:hypothetical protein GJ496_008879 [Pomphorhynchus laevis]
MESTLKELADITNFPDSLMDAIDWRRCKSIPIFQFMLELADTATNSEQCMFTDLCDELSGACIDDEERNPENILPELEKKVHHLSP